MESNTEYKVRFKKIKADHNRIRSETIEGHAVELPQLGKPFVFVGESVDKTVNSSGGMRMVNTSRIMEIDRQGEVFTCTTENNSIYEITVLTYPKGTQ